MISLDSIFYYHFYSRVDKAVIFSKEKKTTIIPPRKTHKTKPLIYLFKFSLVKEKKHNHKHIQHCYSLKIIFLPLE